eukprot:TRINITY_DN3866_c0_g1_i1.p1 TRINITY_DN3866_c0_g1~~TRINITY_DN3866_c0_g1_i1.p1  ORF type:complete len:1631 (-),score=271.67 TRINITY_DN3866_c0_g1_i1:306-5198(-)
MELSGCVTGKKNSLGRPTFGALSNLSRTTRNLISQSKLYSLNHGESQYGSSNEAEFNYDQAGSSQVDVYQNRPVELCQQSNINLDVLNEGKPIPEVADLETILQEKDACGVGVIASLKNERTHDIISKALLALGCMEHRGACSADNDSGDGAGIMTQIPWEIFASDIPNMNQETTGVGMFFLPNDDQAEAESIKITEEVCASEGMKVLGWRDVPVVHEVVGRLAKNTQPRFKQLFIECEEGFTGDELERKLYITRKLIEKKKVDRLGDVAPDFYICSLSNKTIVYKGMLRSAVVGEFYEDLKNPEYITSFAIYHRRYSTNTTPKWPLAQPMRVLGHNGEINTLQGNINWMASRQNGLQNPVWKGREKDLMPLCNAAQSDSANLDNAAELLVRTGFDILKTLMLLVPEAYRNHPDLVKNYPEVIDFYEYYEGLQEGWDGPALIVFSDGKRIGARLDRNGLRPARYWQTNDGYIYVASEVGVLGDVLSNAENVVAKGRLGPGQMVCADLERGIFLENDQIAREVSSKYPFGEWLKHGLRRLEDFNASTIFEDPMMSTVDFILLQSANGMGLEDAQMVVENMAMSGKEPTYCMGDDIPLAVLSDKPHPMYNYFKQRFAQVTNPPIDPLREGLVMSLEMRLGGRGNLLTPGDGSYNQILLKSPILLESELEAVKADTSLGTRVFDIRFQAEVEGDLERALKALCLDVENAVNNGCQCVILSDKLLAGQQMSPQSPPIPTLLAVGAVHHHLIRTSLRSATSIVAETAQCYSTHQAAVLIGYGAHAICPYLAFETARQWRTAPRTITLIKNGKVPDISISDAQINLKDAFELGLLKILSKMGISLLSCYHGAQIFEIYGLGADVVDLAFKGSVSRIGGMSLNDIQKEAEAFWNKGFPDKALKKLEDYGFIVAKPKGEYHANNSAMSKLLHKSVGLGGKLEQGDLEAFQNYQKHFEEAPIHVLRDCLEVAPKGEPIPLDQVESVAEIMTRFCTGGMSLGAISRETHETIAIAMNRIGGKSNSGEGGEDPVRWTEMTDVDSEGNSKTFSYLKGLKNGDLATSRIKQVASGRFGVTPQFLVNADQIEIKIAQGAKPGEGGQLPGKKVSPYIAGLRRSKAGVPLISPPPHHDIYSIEDLAQLIYDLHQVNKDAKVSVKLVAEAGIGTVASGVAKANADVIQISGHDGGTGASPISSIKHAGGPVEMGLAEVHQTLTQNELRERVVLRADGGMRSGRDVIITAALGADEYGFGTVAMIATGCIMARVCHTNNCPVGVASQKEELRARFPGAPGDLVNFFAMIAEEVRLELARLGLRSMDELIGRADLLRQREKVMPKTEGLDLSFLTTFAGATEASSSRIASETHSNGPILDDDILQDQELLAAIESGSSLERSYDVVNTDRAALARVSGAVAKKWGDRGFPGAINFNLKGSGGQSAFCFTVQGVNIRLEGEANDYIGKGMAGGEIVIVPPKNITFDPSAASIVGNTCLYGATGGHFYANGRAGERFGVRNSMAFAVIEGTGDHCCEYMTGGVIVSLGSVGRNVGAGMTGGLAYFLDEEGDFADKVNTEIVIIQRVSTSAGQAQLKGLIQNHLDKTGSVKAKQVLDNWEQCLPKFWQLVPPSEKNSPEANKEVTVTVSASA